MRVSHDIVQLTASDIVGHLSCNHLTNLDLQVASGALAKPEYYDPLLEILRERGYRHESAYLEHLEKQGRSVILIAEEGRAVSQASVQATLRAMKEGHEVIAQAALMNERWSGRADFLMRVDKPSKLGAWSYEVIDTKLARETKGGTVLQLCLYADLLGQMQGIAPEHIHVVAPWSDFEPQTYRVADFSAYFRRVKGSVEQAVDRGVDRESYPEPTAHCDICRWSRQCDDRRRADDHLCLVANISKNQIAELRERDIATVEDLAALPLPIQFQPRKGSPATIEKLREQAAVQVRSRESGKLEYDLLDVVPDLGLAALPEPSEGDIYFDIESDQFVGEHGLEYLLGYLFRKDGEERYVREWALSRDQEKLAFERFIDFVVARRRDFPRLHVYHYGPYEPAALKRLMGRYATREDELDNLLREEVFVDLLSVVRNAMRAGVESYSLKNLEKFAGYERAVALHDANVALTSLSAGLELGDHDIIDGDTRSVVENYNRDDCAATAALHNWLESVRSEAIAEGKSITRPGSPKNEPSEELNERARRVQELIAQLTDGVPVDPEQRSPEQQACWILAHLLDWHRREEKAVWWEYFRLLDTASDDLLRERAGIARLTFIEEVERTKQGIPTHRYAFEIQDTDLRGGESLYSPEFEQRIGEVKAVSVEDRTLDIKKTRATADIHPSAVFAHDMVRSPAQKSMLLQIAEYVAQNGITAPGDFASGRALLLRRSPQLDGDPIRRPGESTLDAAIRVATTMDDGVFPIQGPPGTGKSFTGARVICALVKQGKKVGITANSHKVIRNLIDKVLEAARETGTSLTCIQKPKDREPDQPNLLFTRANSGITSALGDGSAQVAGGTHFFWAREEVRNTVDVLVVDEAAQMSLANVLAASAAAPVLILLGDPQQLEQPTQGSHPDGTDVSALDHILDGHQTISEVQGLFLERTWRLQPKICSFNSELFYESKLYAVDGCAGQVLGGGTNLDGAGLRYLPVPHSGNTSSSTEEADAVQALVERLLSAGTEWTDRDGSTKPLTLDDILAIAPYNAQVFEIKERLPSARVGTVDKFQGQEAPVAIFSMATSSHADAPRGMEFLYSSNRLNVAVSRAKCMAILVASPAVFEAECRTPRQMQLANAFCRYLEVAEEVSAN